MDIQAWRKHLQQVHRVHKTVLTTRFHEQAALVSMKRPCVFCRMPFQKSPNLHRSKCLPLAQLLSVQHGYAGVGGDANCGSVGAVLSDGVNGGIHTRSSTGSQGERGEDEASQVPKAGEGRRKGPDRGSQTPGASLLECIVSMECPSSYSSPEHLQHEKACLQQGSSKDPAKLRRSSSSKKFAPCTFSL